MAINFTDFSKIPVQDSVFTNLWENAFKGYQIGRAPQQMDEEAKQRQLVNALREKELGHKDKEFELSDQGKSLANSLQAKALQYYDEKFKTDQDYKKAQINKLNQKLTDKGVVIKPNGDIANIAWVEQQLNDPNVSTEFKDKLRIALQDKQEHIEAGTERTNVLNETQDNRAKRSPIAQIHYDIGEVNKGVMPGTKDKITPEQQTRLVNDLTLSAIKNVTDPKTREKLINASNMNITLGAINSDNLTQYSGAEGQVNKIADSILESAGAGSEDYKKYQRELVKATAAAKQMRQYLGDSIQPSAQEKLTQLTNPSAWNVSPKLAKENFEFMRDLFKKETQTLVRAATDPTLFYNAANPEQNQNNNQNNTAVKTYNLATKRWE